MPGFIYKDTYFTGSFVIEYPRPEGENMDYWGKVYFTNNTGPKCFDFNIEYNYEDESYSISGTIYEETNEDFVDNWEVFFRFGYYILDFCVYRPTRMCGG